MSNYILEMQHISKEFSGIYALRDVTLAVKQGEIHPSAAKMAQENRR